MPLIIYNQTPYKLEIIGNILSLAHQQVGIDKGTTVVKVTTKRSRIGCSGVAYKSYPRGRLRKILEKYHPPKTWQSDLGWVKISFSGPDAFDLRFKDDPNFDIVYYAARQFYEVALHEFAHIKDYRMKTHITTPLTPTGKRIWWKNRPAEKFAISQVEQVLSQPALVQIADGHIVDLTGNIIDLTRSFDSTNVLRAA